MFFPSAFSKSWACDSCTGCALCVQSVSIIQLIHQPYSLWSPHPLNYRTSLPSNGRGSRSCTYLPGLYMNHASFSFHATELLISALMHASPIHPLLDYSSRHVRYREVPRNSADDWSNAVCRSNTRAPTRSHRAHLLSHICCSQYEMSHEDLSHGISICSAGYGLWSYTKL